jgi:hypothetical protein
MHKKHQQKEDGVITPDLTQADMQAMIDRVKGQNRGTKESNQ